MRTSGILLPISSLPSPGGIGCFSAEAYDFVDLLKKAGQKYWQILPLGPTGYGDSPYQAFSAFAGNPYFIDLDTLAEEGLLDPADCRNADLGDDPGSVDYARQYFNRYPILRKAFERSRLEEDADYLAYCEKEKDWLDDYCLYMAVKQHFGGSSWDTWEEPARLREPSALDELREICREEILFQKFLQYHFMKQWSRLKKYANEKGIRIIGDIPIYVAFDGADSWASPELFQFNEDRRPVLVAGCPPDAFAAEGQLWGNPLYDWEYHHKTDYAWWKKRIARCLALYDVIRVDHFRGFDEYFAIPAGSPSAAGGHWEKGPGMDFFHSVKKEFGDLQIIAEDLGYVTESVIQLVKDSGYPGMKLLEFAFDSREPGDYMPYSYQANTVVYTGTHDNQTLAAWVDELAPEDRAFLEEYLHLRGASAEELVWAVIRLTLGTVSDTAIIPMQDYLCLGAEARINKPSTLGKNWTWRMLPDLFTEDLAKKIRRLTEVYGRS